MGTQAPSLSDARWIVPPASPLDGRVRLVRFWTDTCPFCRASAPALAQLDHRYRDAGLQIVGVYHPKPRGEHRELAQTRDAIAEWDWKFAVADDHDWTLLDALWLSSGDRDYTSVSFLIDRAGLVRYVHPGPEFHEAGPSDHAQCRRDFADLDAAIAHLLAQPT